MPGTRGKAGHEKAIIGHSMVRHYRSQYPGQAGIVTGGMNGTKNRIVTQHRPSLDPHMMALPIQDGAMA